MDGERRLEVLISTQASGDLRVDHLDADVDVGEVAAPASSPPSGAIPTWVALTAVLVLATVARTWQLNRLGFNSDEAVYTGQAASIAGDSVRQPYFPIFRAHPLLFQSLLSVIYRATSSDVAARLASVAFGVGTVAVVFALGRTLYNRRTGLIAAGILALMPYHVLVTRQVLLDGPMVFFATLTLYALARYAMTEQPRWLYATAACMGLTFLTKETGVVLVAAVWAFLVLTPTIRVRTRQLAIAIAVLIGLMALYPLSTALAGTSKTGTSFLTWQLLRRPNHGALFYANAVPLALGVLVIGAALGNVFLRRERTWRETLLVLWVLVPVGFFEFWPVKGYQYLLPIAPAVAVLAARILARLRVDGRIRRGRVSVPWVVITAGLAIAFSASLVVSTMHAIEPSSSGTYLAGSGGVPGGREAGRWVDAHIPENAQLLALGPSMANIIEYYGDRKVFGLSVSTNPLHRNPVYEPIANPDLRIRRGDLQYLVWDSYSANRSPTFAAKLMSFAAKYHGHLVHQETVKTGSTAPRRVIAIYAVRP